ncbi:phosphatase PAP2 family protein [Acidocella sp.]|uniref:phosphatase PAP2 family protein n=1 Tax=Acidocella sp. TaxID=50710 RepID=UPI002635CE8A|nr:phosphatase PAP2 family protein [Acidocella sp.]
MPARRAASPLFYWAGAAGVAAAALLCMATSLDQDLAAFCHAHQRWRGVYQLAAAPSLLALPGAGLILLWALARRLRGGPPPARVWMAAALATLAATAAKDELKWAFGRAWPETWLAYGLGGFHPFAESVLYGSFPSGHTAYAAAPLGVCWALRPRLRPLWGGTLLLVMAGLVAADYHYLSDVLAGLLTGGVCAWGSLVLTRRG